MINSLSLFLLSLWLFTLCHNVSTYSQISAYGGGTKDAGPKIFKALNADLVFPETLNLISTTSRPLATTSSTLSANDANLSDAVKPALPAIYVTPPTTEQISFTPQMHNKQVIGSNQMSDTMKTDYQRQPMQDATYESQTLNSANNNQQQQQQQLEQYTSTGRAVDYRPAYQFDQFTNAASKLRTAPIRPYVLRQPGSYAFRPQKAQSTQYGNGKIVPYPQSSYRQYKRPPQILRRPLSQSDIYKMGGGGVQISDRFTPGEAVASALFTQKAQKHHHHHQNHNNNYNVKQGGKLAASSNFVQSFVPSSDLYAFPPNVNAKYPKPSEDPKAALPSSNVNSYVPPPAGPISNAAGYPIKTAANSDSGYKYPGPVNQAYLPPSNGNNEKPKDDNNAKPAVGDDNSENNDDTIGVLPASAMGGSDDNKNSAGDDDVGGDMNNMDDMNSMPLSDNDNDHDHDHDHDHDDDHSLRGYDTGKEYPTPPPGWMEEHPDSDHFHFPHHFPEIIYDDHHDFHHDHHHDEPAPTPHSTAPPPPEPLPSEQPQEPRVKKYSYFYIGRKLWYIPLYFTVWFSFYVLWLILKSIARHKVNLPNHYVSRRSLTFDDANAKEQIDKMTVSVMQQIEDFHKKYLT